MDGWTPGAWADELDRKADCCEELNPTLAAEYRAGAIAVRAKMNGRTEATRG